MCSDLQNCTQLKEFDSDAGCESEGGCIGVDRVRRRVGICKRNRLLLLLKEKNVNFVQEIEKE